MDLGAKGLITDFLIEGEKGIISYICMAVKADVCNSRPIDKGKRLFKGGDPRIITKNSKVISRRFN